MGKQDLEGTDNFIRSYSYDDLNLPEVNIESYHMVSKVTHVEERISANI